MVWLPIIRRWEVKCMPTLEWSAFEFWLSMVVVLRWNVLATRGMDRICSSHNTSLCSVFKNRSDQIRPAPFNQNIATQWSLFFFSLLFFLLLFLYCYYFADSKHVTWSLMIRYWDVAAINTPNASIHVQNVCIQWALFKEQIDHMDLIFCSFFSKLFSEISLVRRLVIIILIP